MAIPRSLKRRPWCFLLLAILAASSAGAASPGGDRDGDEPDDKALTRYELGRRVQKIDQLVNAGLREHHVHPNPPLDNEKFLRRIYLDIIGRVPTAEEARRFLDSHAHQKRPELIDELLDSPGYVSHTFNYFADLLRVRDRLNNNVSGQPYIHWIKNQIRENRPYDRIVYDLLTAGGRIHDDPAAGYYLRDPGMPLDRSANTVRVFLGTSIGCAMCHDHPFDKWSQREFYEMAAFTYGTRTRQRTPAVRKLYKLAKERYKPSEDKDKPVDRENRRLVRTLRRLGRSYSYKVRETGRDIRLPKDYKYSDGEPNEKVAPFTIFGEVIEGPAEGETLRETFAAWATSRENPRFTKVIANRLWKRAFGRGLFEPVDEISESTESANPDLTEYLTRMMKDLDYDMKQFMRVLYNTRAYQRQASRTAGDPEKTYRFPGPALRRMSAEQMWDSMITLAVGNPDDDLENGEGSYYTPPDLENMSEDQLLAYAKRLSGGGRKMMMKMMGRTRARRGKGPYAGFIRASELPQPAPPGHFLWRFGQSDRDLIQNASREPTKTQVLTLMNGPIDNVLLKKRSELWKDVHRMESARDKLEIIWLSILSRRPTNAEVSYAKQEVRAHGDTAFGDLVWALLNTREFMFVQ